VWDGLPFLVPVTRLVWSPCLCQILATLHGLDGRKLTRYIALLLEHFCNLSAKWRKAANSDADIRAGRNTGKICGFAGPALSILVRGSCLVPIVISAVSTVGSIQLVAASVHNDSQRLSAIIWA